MYVYHIKSLLFIVCAEPTSRRPDFLKVVLRIILYTPESIHTFVTSLVNSENAGSIRLSASEWQFFLENMLQLYKETASPLTEKFSILATHQEFLLALCICVRTLKKEEKSRDIKLVLEHLFQILVMVWKVCSVEKDPVQKNYISEISNMIWDELTKETTEKFYKQHVVLVEFFYQAISRDIYSVVRPYEVLSTLSEKIPTASYLNLASIVNVYTNKVSLSQSTEAMGRAIRDTVNKAISDKQGNSVVDFLSHIQQLHLYINDIISLIFPIFKMECRMLDLMKFLKKHATEIPLSQKLEEFLPLLIKNCKVVYLRIAALEVAVLVLGHLTRYHFFFVESLLQIFYILLQEAAFVDDDKNESFPERLIRNLYNQPIRPRKNSSENSSESSAGNLEELASDRNWIEMQAKCFITLVDTSSIPGLSDAAYVSLSKVKYFKIIFLLCRPFN